MVLEHSLLSHNSKPCSWYQERLFLIKNTGGYGASKVPACHSAHKSTKVISAQFQSSHKPAPLHPGNNSLNFPNSSVFHLYNPAKKRTSGTSGEGNISWTYQLTGFFSASFFKFFFPSPRFTLQLSTFFFFLPLTGSAHPVAGWLGNCRCHQKRKTGRAHFLTRFMVALLVFLSFQMIFKPMHFWSIISLKRRA